MRGFVSAPNALGLRASCPARAVVAPGRLALAGARRWPNGGLPAEGWKRETGRGRRVKVNGRE